MIFTSDIKTFVEPTLLHQSFKLKHFFYEILNHSRVAPLCEKIDILSPLQTLQVLLERLRGLLWLVSVKELAF